MAMDDEIAIKVENAGKTFRLPHEKNDSIKSAVINFYRSNRTYEKQEALKDVSFEVKKGEFFGIVGRNGSGKSTLLKMLAGIYSPSKGTVQVNGKLTPFIELGVGFSPELTGRENVFLNGALLGFSRKEMQTMYKDIVKFAELERFMDQKLKNYSSGMQVRLAFSIAIRANTDILVLDEVLAVGDANFQKKCFDYFSKLKRDKKTIVLVTHDMDAVVKYCDRAMLIQDGNLELIGSPGKVSKQYLLENYEENTSTTKQLSEAVKSLDLEVKSEIRLTTKDVFEFDITYELNEDLPVYLGLSIMFENTPIIQHNSLSIKLAHSKGRKHRVSYKLPLADLNQSEFRIDVAIFKSQDEQLIGYKTDACEFFVTNKSDKTKSGPLQSYGIWEKVK